MYCIHIGSRHFRPSLLPFETMRDWQWRKHTNTPAYPHTHFTEGGNVISFSFFHSHATLKTGAPAGWCKRLKRCLVQEFARNLNQSLATMEDGDKKGREGGRNNSLPWQLLFIKSGAVNFAVVLTNALRGGYGSRKWMHSLFNTCGISMALFHVSFRATALTVRLNAVSVGFCRRCPFSNWSSSAPPVMENIAKLSIYLL